jgi:hypothetical protein
MVYYCGGVGAIRDDHRLTSGHRFQWHVGHPLIRRKENRSVTGSIVVFGIWSRRMQDH